MKIRDRADIRETLAVVIPETRRERLEEIVPEKIRGKTYFLDDSGPDIWEWAEKVCSFVHDLAKEK